jgi:integrase
LPFFSEYKINNIEPIDIIRWHNDREQYISKNGKKLSTAYLKKMHGQLSAIFNFAIKFYNLKRNPASIAGNFVEETEEIKEDVIQQEQWWDVNQYQVFAEAAMDNDFYYHLFETLYWNGLRIGEALALRKKDFDFANKRLYVRGNSSGRKCARNEEGKLIFSKSITSPKNGKSRCIQMFDSYAEEMEDFISRLYNLQDNDIIFNVAKRTVQNHWKSIWKKTNLPYMNLHGTRHSHVSLLFSLGFNVVQIAQRLGHQETSITYMYAGILKSDEKEMMMKLDKIRNEVNNYGV